MSNWEVCEEYPNLTGRDYGDELGGVVEVETGSRKPKVYRHLTWEGEEVLWTERRADGWSNTRSVQQMVKFM